MLTTNVERMVLVLLKSLLIAVMPGATIEELKGLYTVKMGIQAEWIDTYLKKAIELTNARHVHFLEFL